MTSGILQATSNFTATLTSIDQRKSFAAGTIQVFKQLTAGESTNGNKLIVSGK
jgi:hypothetical protein